MERLTDDRFLKDGFYQPKSKEEEKEIRSMGNDLTFEKLYKHCAEVEKQNAELQKKVDWLKKDREAVFNEMSERMKAEVAIEKELGVRKCEQAVKDTAKEIFTEIFESIVFSFKGNEDYKKGFFDALEQYDKQLRDLAKQNGVEVE